MSDKTADVLKPAGQIIPAPSPVQADRLRAAAVMRHVAPELERLFLQGLCITVDNAPDIPERARQALYGDFTVDYDEDFQLSFADVRSVLRSSAASKLPSPGKVRAASVSVASSVISFRAAITPPALAANDHTLRPAGKAYGSVLSEKPVQDGYVRVGDIPAHIAEKALRAMAARLSKRLCADHGLSRPAAAVLSENAKQRAVLLLCQDLTRGPAIGRLARNMETAGRLTPSFITRAAGCGYMRVAQYALAQRARITPAKAALMLYAPGDMGLRALAQHAGIGLRDVHILRAATVLFRELETSGLDYDSAYFRRRIMDAILGSETPFSDSDADYLLEKLDGLGAQEFH